MLLSYDLLNVFATSGDPFSGNPLAVVRDPGLDTRTCQAIARQFNLSETTFVVVPPRDDPGMPHADVRIFTPTIELPFAGHPTLGTAYIVGRECHASEVTLRLGAGPIPVVASGDRWVLRANPATIRESDAGATELATMIGVATDRVRGSAWWVDSGIDQLLVEVTDVAAVRAAVPDAPLVRQLAMSERGEALAYVWAWTGPDTVEARLFFSQDSAVVEDPATGSAAANLGGLLAGRGQRGRTVTIAQGAAVDRPSELVVEVTDTGVVRVGGLVRHVGAGQLGLD